MVITPLQRPTFTRNNQSVTANDPDLWLLPRSMILAISDGHSQWHEQC